VGAGTVCTHAHLLQNVLVAQQHVGLAACEQSPHEDAEGVHVHAAVHVLCVAQGLGGKVLHRAADVAGEQAAFLVVLHPAGAATN
jgi:hypothetical protein